MIVKQIVLFLLLLLVMFLSLRVVYGLVAFLFRKKTLAMYVPSFDRHIRLMKQLKLIRGKKLVDLWCGDGKALRFFAKEFAVECEGYEIQIFPYYYGKVLNYLLWYPQLKLYKKDFSQTDLKRYDYIYIYLLPKQMAEIESRLFTHINPHSIIISNSFQFAVHKPYSVIKNAKWIPSIFLYRK